MVTAAPETVTRVIREVVLDTTFVHDTTWVGILHQHADGWGITPADWVGWAVTLAGFVVAAIIAVTGWKAAAATALRTQEHRKKIEDDAALETFMDMLAESLKYYLERLPHIISVVDRDGVIGEREFVHLDTAREGYDRSRERLVLMKDEYMRRRIGRWFFDERLWRESLERYYTEPTPGERRQPIVGVAKHWLKTTLEEADREGHAIYEELGFHLKYPGEAGYEDPVVVAHDDAMQSPSD